MGGEDKSFSRGKERLVFNYRGFNISPYICYDLRFPVWSRSEGDTDLIIYSANWPFARQNVWNTLLKARAIENQCFVAGSNRTGTDGEGISYQGGSMVINARGEEMTNAGSDSDVIINTRLSKEELTEFRKKFPVFDDADSFELDLS
jgi:predicted amidohydrolase